MFFFKYYRRNNSASIYEWDKKERENWVSEFQGFENVMYLIYYPYIFEHKDRVHLVTCV